MINLNQFYNHRYGLIKILYKSLLINCYILQGYASLLAVRAFWAQMEIGIFGGPARNSG